MASGCPFCKGFAVLAAPHFLPPGYVRISAWIGKSGFSTDFIPSLQSFLYVRIAADKTPRTPGFQTPWFFVATVNSAFWFSSVVRRVHTVNTDRTGNLVATEVQCNVQLSSLSLTNKRSVNQLIVTHSPASLCTKTRTEYSDAEAPIPLQFLTRNYGVSQFFIFPKMRQ